MTLPDPPLLVVTDRRRAGRPLPDVVRDLVAAGARWVMLREKDLSEAEYGALAAEVALAAAPARVVANTHVAIGGMLDGVHLPAGGDAVAAIGRVRPDCLVGLSTHGLAEIERARAAGVDYVTYSPIFLTASKPGYGPALGPATLAPAAALGVPVIALGGITPANASACLSAGARGLAVMGSAMAPDGPATVRALIAALRSAGRPGA